MAIQIYRIIYTQEGSKDRCRTIKLIALYIQIKHPMDILFSDSIYMSESSTCHTM